MFGGKMKTHPNLKFDALVLTKDGLNLEVDPDCTDEGGCERVVCIAKQEGSFPH